MLERKLCVIPGDGIGPEVTSAAIQVLQEATSNVEIVYAQAGWQTFSRLGDSVPEETFAAIRDCGAALFGAVSSPSRKVEGYRSAILRIRQTLELYANVRPVKDVWANEPQDRIDMVIVRENSEGLYGGQERQQEDRVVAEKVVTRPASMRIARVASEVAAIHEMDQVTIVHKANVLPLSEGLFRDVARETIQHHASGLTINEGLVDIVAHNLVAQPEKFQVLVTTNMFGDILSDLAAYWCGGMGRAPSLNLGDEYAVAEPVHGSAPDIAGQGIADPAATILSMALLSRYYWKDQTLANRLEQATINAIRSVDRDSFTTSGFTAAVIGCLQELDFAT